MPFEDTEYPTVLIIYHVTYVQEFVLFKHEPWMYNLWFISIYLYAVHAFWCFATSCRSVVSVSFKVHTTGPFQYGLTFALVFYHMQKGSVSALCMKGGLCCAFEYLLKLIFIFSCFYHHIRNSFIVFVLMFINSHEQNRYFLSCNML